MSTATRLFCMWMHRTLMIVCVAVFIIDLATGAGGISFLLLFPLAINAVAAEMHRRLLERSR